MQLSRKRMTALRKSSSSEGGGTLCDSTLIILCLLVLTARGTSARAGLLPYSLSAASGPQALSSPSCAVPIEPRSSARCSPELGLGCSSWEEQQLPPIRHKSDQVGNSSPALSLAGGTLLTASSPAVLPCRDPSHAASPASPAADPWWIGAVPARPPSDSIGSSLLELAGGGAALALGALLPPAAAGEEPVAEV
eukprot:758085-Hanusia_phi.AAC.4